MFLHLFKIIVHRQTRPKPVFRRVLIVSVTDDKQLSKLIRSFLPNDFHAPASNKPLRKRRQLSGATGKILPKPKKAMSKLIDFKSLIIASTTVGGDLLSTIFNFYYIKVFLTIYYLNNRWLNAVQILFAVWNAVNDPLFGCVQDLGFVWCPRWIMNRRKVILYMGPIYAFSFVTFWLPWSTTGEPPWLVGLHLLAALFFYDSMVSFVLSAQCGLFTEYTTEHGSRVRLIVYLEIASLIAGFVILPVDAVSKSLSNFYAFQISTGVVAVLAGGFFLITGLFASDIIAQTQDSRREKPLTAKDSFRGGYRASKSILKNRDFWCVVAGNFFHIMRMTGDANFLAILTEALLSPNGILTLGSIQLSLFYTGCSVLSKAFLVMCWPLLHRHGAFVCLMMTLLLSLINCVAAAIIGRSSYTWLALFFLIENILAKGLWPAVYNIFFPDIIDEDMLKHKRKAPLSTMIFTLNALFTKPAHSIAPIIIVAILNRADFGRYLEMKKLAYECNATIFDHDWRNGINCTSQLDFFNSTIKNSFGDALPEEGQTFDGLFSTMFYVACFYPLACIVLEAMCFLPYRLRSKKDDKVIASRDNVPCSDEKLLTP